MSWLPSAPGVLAFARGDGFACVVNLSGEPAELPAHREVLASSEPIVEGRLPRDAAVWLATSMFAMYFSRVLVPNSPV